MVRLNAKWNNFTLRGQVWDHFWQDAAGNDVSIALSGVSLSQSQGTVTPRLLRLIRIGTGLEETISQGDITPVLSFDVNLTGQSQVISQGDLTPRLLRLIRIGTGLEETLSQGTISISAGSTLQLTGESQAINSGTLTSLVGKVLSGVIETTNTGSMAAALNRQVSGNQAIVSVGTIGLSRQIALTAVPLEVITQGAITPVMTFGVNLTGQSQTINSGTLSAQIAKAISGAIETVGSGQLSPSLTCLINLTSAPLEVITQGVITPFLEGTASFINPGHLIMRSARSTYTLSSAKKEQINSVTEKQSFNSLTGK